MADKITLVSSFYYQIFSYVNGNRSLNDFENWIVAHLDQLLSVSDSDTRELVNVEELGRAEMSEGHRTEDEFKEELRQFIRSHPTIITGFDEVSDLKTTSSSATQTTDDITGVGEVQRFSYIQL